MPLQRNATDHPLDVWAVPATVQPGEVIDWHDPISGFELVEDESADTNTEESVGQEQEQPPEPDTPKTPRKRAARPAGEESTS